MAKTANGQQARNQSRPKDGAGPIQEIRVGRIKAAIWLNETEVGVRHNVTISRLYNKDGQWQDSSSFGRDDLLVVAEVARQASLWIYVNAQTGSGS